MINVGVEGTALAGALLTAIVAYYTGSPGLALLAALAVGAFLGLVHATWAVYLRADHVVSGVAINLLVSGAALFSTRILWGWREPPLPRPP